MNFLYTPPKRDFFAKRKNKHGKTCIKKTLFLLPYLNFNVQFMGDLCTNLTNAFPLIQIYIHIGLDEQIQPLV